MISVAEAHSRLLALFSRLDQETVPLERANGRALAADVVAARSQPPFSASAMDGYAVRNDDVAPGTTLTVIGTSTAGERTDLSISLGTAVRIFTGAPVPDGADRIVIQEDVTRDGDRITLGTNLDSQVYIRPAGTDFEEGARLQAGQRLDPSRIALIAAMNHGTVQVSRKPVVAIIATGNELVTPGSPVGRDQIPASNTYGIQAMLQDHGAEARLMPIAEDTPESLTAVLDLASDADLIVTIGGASVGDFDLVQSTAVERGLQLEFHKIAMRPGKPLMAGTLKGTPMIGLPGNPVSAMVCARLFLVPVVHRMLGLPDGMPERHTAELATDIGKNGIREHYMRATVSWENQRFICAPWQRQDSSLLSVLAKSNALMVRAPEDPARQAGDLIEFLWL